MTDSSGQVVERFTYDNHYGKIITHTKTVETDNPYAYTGRVFDTAELYYYRARYYDPTIERFISEDPIGFNGQDFNFYRYVWDSPVILIDPTGYQGIDPMTGIPVDIMQPIYDFFNNLFGDKPPKPPTTLDKIVHGVCRDTPIAIEGFMKSLRKLNNMDTSKMTPLSKGLFEYLYINEQRNLNINESPINLIDKLDTINSILNVMDNKK